MKSLPKMAVCEERNSMPWNSLVIFIVKHFLQPFRCSPLVAVKVECIEGVLRADRERDLKIFWLDNKFPYPSALGYRDVNLGVGMQVRSRTEHRPQTWRGEHRGAGSASTVGAANHHSPLCSDFAHT